MAPRYLRPDRFTRTVVNPLVRLLGAATTLAVARRRSGGVQLVPVNVLERDGERYLVSARGETEWVRNLRAGGRCELRRRGKARWYSVVELPLEERQPVIDAYRQRWDSQVKRFFTELPDPADHPVFQLRAE